MGKMKKKKTGEEEFFPAFLVQRYIHNPLLIDGHKFDLRVFVFVEYHGAGAVGDHHTTYLFADAVVRHCAHPYNEDNNHDATLSDPLAHLTNVAVNSNNERIDGHTCLT